MTIHRSELASGIVSTALSRGSVRIRTDNLTLALPVVITIHHSDFVKVGVYMHREYRHYSTGKLPLEKKADS